MSYVYEGTDEDFTMVLDAESGEVLVAYKTMFSAYETELFLFVASHNVSEIIDISDDEFDRIKQFRV